MSEPNSRHPLTPFFAPRTVAVIGATESAGSYGRLALWNLISNPFGGTVFPVNPRRSSVLGVKAYPHIAAVPEPVDLAVVITPAPSVPDVIGQCAAAGVRGAMVLSAGFRERGADGAALEQQILARAGQGGIRVLGPGSLGLMRPRRGLNATLSSTLALPGSVGFISQSGALCSALLDWSLQENVGFSAFISVGGMLDVGWGDLIDYLGEDPDTSSIVIYLETLGAVRALLSAAREVALSKPIIVLKAGRGGLASDGDAALDAAFRRCGVLRVDSITDMFAMAEVLAKQPRPRGPRLSILTNAGAPGLLAADALLANGGALAAPAPETQAALHQQLPQQTSGDNPIDLLADADAARYGRATNVAVRDPHSDGLLVILTPLLGLDPARAAQEVVEHTRGTGRPVLASWMGGARVTAGVSLLNQAGIPTFAYPDLAARAFTLMWQYTSALRSLYETPALADDAAVDRPRADALVAAARAEGRTLLTEAEVAGLLAAYGIPTLPPGAPVPPAGYELMLGCATDPQFGPLLLFGAGGRLAELGRDRALGLPPLTSTLARRMVEQTRIFAALSPPAQAALEQALLRLSRLVVEQRWLQELEINPLLVGEGEALALGARAALHPLDLPAEALPPLAIRPYPTQYIAPWTLRDGTPVLIRPIRPEDEPLIVAFHETLSEQSVYFRYFHQLGLAQRITHERLARMCFIDYDRAMALVVVRERTPEQEAQILAVGRLMRQHGGVAEFALLVSDRYQRQGIGRELMQRLLAVGRAEGTRRIVGYILPENTGMRRICEQLGFRSRRADGMIEASIELE
ncbi:MAG TPA: GNAT family N-acetyltransferase [Roseiflexaceae bacterium]|nr:GNAT family N-acetyltransferase [Roseiflexaceae bacterium]